MKYPNVGVYWDSDTVRYQLGQFTNFQPLRDCTTFVDSAVFMASSLSCRIAVLHVPYPFNYEFVNHVRVLLQHANHIFIIATEVHPKIVEFIRNTDNTKITYYICGFLNFTLQYSKVKQFMDWFETSSYFYKHWLPEILTRLHPYEPKKVYFDVLLGRKKFHRDELYKHTQSKSEIGIITYFNDYDGKFDNDTSKWIWEHTGVNIETTPKWTVDCVRYYGYQMSISQIIPINIYNQTAYSAVAETCFDDNFSFFTEKTSKPIIAKRLFIMFAGQKYLANLKKLGFKTFENIIDESYDNEPDSIVRWHLAWEQMVFLSKQPQQQILEQIRPIVEHNFEVMMTTNWAANFRQELEQDIVRIIAG
jgi:hypothetical protein